MNEINKIFILAHLMDAVVNVNHEVGIVGKWLSDKTVKIHFRLQKNH